MTGTLLLCRRCGDVVEQLGKTPTDEHIEAHREAYRCDCGGELDLLPPEPRVVISHLEYRGG